MAIRLMSASIGATEEDVRSAIEQNGYEVDEPEAQEKPARPLAPLVSDDGEQFFSPDELVAFYKKSRTPEEKAALHYKMNIGFDDALEKFKEEHPDFDKVVNRNLAVPWVVHVNAEIRRLQNPALLYHLGRDRQFLEKLKATKSPQEAAFEINKLHQRLKPDPEDERYIVTHKGSTVLSSPRQAPPGLLSARPASRPVKPRTLGEAAQRGDYQAFKRLSNKQTRSQARAAAERRR